MAKETAVAFRDFLRNHPEVEEQAREIVRTQGSVDITEFARQQGYEFTREEGEAAWAEVSVDSELSDFELEMVAGGGRHPCGTDDTRFSTEDGFRAADQGAHNAIS